MSINNILNPISAQATSKYTLDIALTHCNADPELEQVWVRQQRLSPLEVLAALGFTVQYAPLEECYEDCGNEEDNGCEREVEKGDCDMENEDSCQGSYGDVQDRVDGDLR